MDAFQNFGKTFSNALMPNIAKTQQLLKEQFGNVNDKVGLLQQAVLEGTVVGNSAMTDPTPTRLCRTREACRRSQAGPPEDAPSHIPIHKRSLRLPNQPSRILQ